MNMRMVFSVIPSYLDNQNIQSYNNRLFKKEDGSFELRMASSEQMPERVVEYEGKTIHVCTFDWINERNERMVMYNYFDGYKRPNQDLFCLLNRSFAPNLSFWPSVHRHLPES